MKTSRFSMFTRIDVLAPCALLLAVSGCGKPEMSSSQPKDFSAIQFNGSDLPFKTLALTFDDGPGPRTEELSNYLKSQGIAATFFFTGDHAAPSAALLPKINAAGHFVANHTYTHPDMPSVSDPIEQVRDTDNVIAPFVTNNIFLFRAPYGAWNSSLATQLNNAGLRKYVGPIYWDIGGEIDGNGHAADWDCWGQGWSVNSCAQGYLKEIHDRNRGIVLAHDVHSKTIDMFKQIIPTLKAEGYKFVTVDASPKIAAAIKAAGGGTPPKVGAIECPVGYTLKSVGTLGGKYCTDGVNMWGPFTQVMVNKCISWGGGDVACNTDRWNVNLGLSARGTGLCPAGAAYDSETTYCVEGINAFGPFPKVLVDKCIAGGGGEVTCKSARWNRNFLKSLLAI